MSDEIAVLGLGKMGTAYAERLLEAGRPVTVWNRTPGKAAELVAAGAVEAGSSASAAGGRIALTMLADDAALAALHAEGGLLSGDAAPALWIDSSTVSPEAATAASAAAKAVGTVYISAPVSGNPGVVRAGNAIFAVSGDDPDAVETAAGVLRDIGREVHVVGAGVSATMVKICTNAILGIVMQSLGEVAVLGQQWGVSRAGLMGFINDSAVGSNFSRYKTASIVQLDMTPTFTAEGIRKDLRLAIDSARTVDVPTPLVAAAELEFSRAAASGIAEGKDFAAVILQIARDSGIELTPEN